MRTEVLEVALRMRAHAEMAPRRPPRRRMDGLEYGRESDALTLECVPGLGFTYCANRDIASGELLLRERPLLVQPLLDLVLPLLVLPELLLTLMGARCSGYERPRAVRAA